MAEYSNTELTTEVTVTPNNVSVSSPSIAGGDVVIRASDEAYKLGRLDRATRKNNPPGRSGDAAIYESADLMNRRTRNAYLNNALVKRAVNVLRDIVVGSGINAFSDPVDYTFGWKLAERPETVLEDSFNYALESDELFAEYCEGECDATGKLSFAEMQAMTISENNITGDVILLECVDKRPGRIIPICYQMLEKEQIDVTKDRPRVGSQNAIVNGFELDQFNREIAVHLYDEHPYGNGSFGILESKRITSDRYLHVFRGLRPSQTSGVTNLHAAGQAVTDRDTWFEAELRSAIKASLHVIVHNLNNPNVGVGFDDGEAESADEVSFGDSPLAHRLMVGEDVKLIESNRPNSKAAEFFDMLEHDIAGAVDLSFYSLTGKFDKTNYGGFRGAMNLEDAQIRPIQNWLGRKMILPIRRRFNELAVGLGKLKTITGTEFIAERRRFQRFDVIGPGRNLLEPAAENEAILGMLRGGLTTLKIECARRGLHWIRVLRQICLENRLASWLNIVLDHSKGQGGQATGNTRGGGSEDSQAINNFLEKL